MHTSYNTFDGVTYPSNGLVVQEGDSLYLIDPAWGVPATRALLQKIEQEIGLPIHRAVATHFHDDRVAGVDLLERQGIEVYAHPETQRRARMEGNAVPDLTFTALDQPGETMPFGPVEILYPGPAHSPDNVMVWIPEQKVLFGGCAIRAADATMLGNTEDADLTSWPKAIRRAQKRYPQAEIVVPGHGAIGGTELLTHTLELFEE